MKRSLLASLAFAALCVSCGQSEIHNNYYVATTGNDAAPGTIDEPFRTISKAASIMEAGDECIIREGLYRETIIPLNSGEEGSPITFKAYENEEVWVDGTDVIEGWELYKDNIYTAKVHQPMIALPQQLQAMYYNDEVMDIARWPNNEDHDPFSFEGFYVDGGTASSVYAESGLPTFDLTGGIICYFGEHCGTTWVRPILKSDNQNIHYPAVDIEDWPFSVHNPTNNHLDNPKRADNKGQIYIYNMLELLDYEDEWYYDPKDGSLYAIFDEGKQPKDGEVKFNTRTHTVNVATDYIQIEGLNLFGGEVRFAGDYCALRNCNLQNCSQVSNELDSQKASIPHAALMIEGAHFTAEHNLIEHGSNNGIVAGGIGVSNTRVDNNIIRYFNTLGIHAKPISVSGNNAVVTRNTIYMCGRDGITTNGRNCEVSYNDVSHCMMINNDGGVYYTVGNYEYKHTEIHHNWFHDSFGPDYSDGRAAGVYLDNYSKGYDVYNNVVSNVTWSGLQYNLYCTDYDYYNNTTWNSGYSTGHWVNGFRIERINISNNVANAVSYETGEDWIGTNVSESNIISAEELFEDSENGNFMPKEGSVLVDAGEVIPYYTAEIVGSKPDIGAYERGGERWVAGATWVDEVN